MPVTWVASFRRMGVTKVHEKKQGNGLPRANNSEATRILAGDGGQRVFNSQEGNLQPRPVGFIDSSQKKYQAPMKHIYKVVYLSHQK